MATEKPEFYNLNFSLDFGEVEKKLLVPFIRIARNSACSCALLFTTKRRKVCRDRANCFEMATEKPEFYNKNIGIFLRISEKLKKNY